MKPFLHKRHEYLAFGLLLSGMMSFIVSGISTVLARGITPGLPMEWLGAWLPSWVVAFPAVLVVAPFVRRILHRMVIH